MTNKYPGQENIEDLYKDEPYIHTQAGRFYLDRPVFHASAIAHSLGQLARFNGHTDHFYSVAEHCCLVSHLMSIETGGDPYEGLLHDALEAFLTDIPSPWKHLFPDIKRFDDALEAKLRIWAGLPGAHKSAECKTADLLALFIEAYFLLPEQGADFHDPWNLRPRALELIERFNIRPACLPWRQASKLWLLAYETYQDKAAEEAGSNTGEENGEEAERHALDRAGWEGMGEPVRV